MESLPAQLHAFALTGLSMLAWLALLCLVFIPLERLLGQPPGAQQRRDWGHNLAYYFLSSIVPALALSAPVAVMATLAGMLLPPAIPTAMAALPLPARIALAFLVGEIGFYWGHRLSHALPFLWRFHAVHHSPDHLYFLVHTRAHPVDMIVTRLCGIAPLYLLGLAGPTAAGSAMPAALLVFGALWGFFIHANLRVRLGPLEWLISTPAFHHWHHQRDASQSCNYASTLPLLDKLFGSLRLPPAFPAAYGIDTPMSATLGGQMLDPLRPRHG